MDTDVLISRHRLRLEPPDLVFITNEGDISLEEAIALFSRIEAFAQGKEMLLMLFDVERSETVTPQARRLVIDRVSKLPIGGIAIIGAAFGQRVIATLMGKAMLLLYPSVPAVRFFATEAEARAWLNERRLAAKEPT